MWCVGQHAAEQAVFTVIYTWNLHIYGTQDVYYYTRTTNAYNVGNKGRTESRKVLKFYRISVPLACVFGFLMIVYCMQIAIREKVGLLGSI